MKKTEKAEGFPGTEAGGQEGQTAAKPKRGRKPRAVKKQGAEPAVENATEAETEPVIENAVETETGSVTETAADTETDPAMESTAGTETGPVAETAVEAETEPVTENTAGTEADPVEGNMAEAENESAPPAVPVPMTGCAEVAESPLKRMKQEFQQRAQVIKEQMRNIQNAFITIGFQLHWIRENNMFRVLNYRNVYEYAEKEYGIKKTTCCNFISIIENYADRDEDGQVIESIADCYRNYSASQLVAMLGMTDEMKQQVTPDMSVRAISRLRKGEPGSSEEMEGVPVPAEETAPAGDSRVETEDIPVHNETETVPVQETEETAGEPAGNPEEPEAPETADGDTETDGGYAVEEERGPAGDNDGTLAEIDSYSDYRSMADELDLIMRHVFATTASVRVKIVCVQG